jgi:competence protein ComEA
MALLDLASIEPPSAHDRVVEVVALLGGRRVLIGAVLGVAAVALVAALFVWPRTPPVEDSLPMATAPSSSSEPLSTSTTATTVVVYAAGAIAHPGVYEFATGARVDDLLAAAGGAIAGADLDRLNLAAPLADGTRIYVPRKGEVEPPVVAGNASPSGDPGGTGTDSASSNDAAAPSSPVDLNSADESALESLPGVGPATAAAIIAYRQEHGPFTSVDQLLDVRGIGDGKMAQLRDFVVVG